MSITRYRGFTLVELMVSISIIAILSAVVLANLNSARETGRDAQRKSDLTNLKAAIELYRQKNGAYPDKGVCPDDNADTFISEKECPVYIIGLAPTFIARLPQDPSLGSNEGYAYLVNSTKTVFKLMAMGTVEHEVVTAASAMRSCDVGTSGICVPAATVCLASHTRFKTSYAVWGGYADVADALVVTETAKTICK